MGNITLQDKMPKKTNVITRSSISHVATTQEFSPIGDNKKIFYYGKDISSINLTVQSLDKKGFSPDKQFKLFSDEFSGEIKLDSINVNEYSELPYTITQISGIGKSNEQIKVVNSNNIKIIKGLEDIYSLNWQTTYTPHLGTGYSFSVSAKTKELANKETFSFSVGEKTFNIGKKSAKLLNITKQLNRVYSGVAISKSDPLPLVLSKTVVISTTENPLLSNIVDGDKVLFYSATKINNLFHTYIKKGDVVGFLSELIGNEIKITEGKNISPVLQALKNTSTAGGSLVNNRINEAITKFLQPKICTVGDIISQILNFIGMEFYYSYQTDSYTIDSPRILYFEGNKSDITLSKDDVISINSHNNLASTPSLMIPNIDFKNMTLSSIAQNCSQMLAGYILKKMSKIKDLPVFKIETFSVPEILFPVEKELNKKSLFEKMNGYFSDVWLYYAGLSMRSVFSNINNGSIQIVPNFDIIEPHKWYKIEDTWYYVTSISISFSRGSIIMNLQYSGIYDQDLYKILDELKQIMGNSTQCEKTFNDFFKDKHTPFNQKVSNKSKPSEVIKDIKNQNIKQLDF